MALFGGFSGSAYGQGAHKVSGTVTSVVDGETLSGVNILVKGTSTRTFTDANGEYSLSVSS